MWVRLGAVARSQGIGWRSGLEAVYGVYCNRHVFRDPLEITATNDEHDILKIKKTSAVRSRISSKLISASYVGYFDRAYYGFYVTSSRC